VFSADHAVESMAVYRRRKQQGEFAEGAGMLRQASLLAPDDQTIREHLALALLCAGAMLHVLEDMGAPAHARDDLRASMTARAVAG